MTANGQIADIPLKRRGGRVRSLPGRWRRSSTRRPGCGRSRGGLSRAGAPQRPAPSRCGLTAAAPRNGSAAAAERLPSPADRSRSMAARWFRSCRPARRCRRALAADGGLYFSTRSTRSPRDPTARISERRSMRSPARFPPRDRQTARRRLSGMGKNIFVISLRCTRSSLRPDGRGWSCDPSRRAGNIGRFSHSPRPQYWEPPVEPCGASAVCSGCGKWGRHFAWIASSKVHTSQGVNFPWQPKCARSLPICPP
jgi:hypothetical protein